MAMVIVWSSEGLDVTSWFTFFGYTTIAYLPAGVSPRRTTSRSNGDQRLAWRPRPRGRRAPREVLAVGARLARKDRRCVRILLRRRGASGFARPGVGAYSLWSVPAAADPDAGITRPLPARLSPDADRDQPVRRLLQRRLGLARLLPPAPHRLSQRPGSVWPPCPGRSAGRSSSPSPCAGSSIRSWRPRWRRWRCG